MKSNQPVLYSEPEINTRFTVVECLQGFHLKAHQSSLQLLIKPIFPSKHTMCFNVKEALFGLFSWNSYTHNLIDLFYGVNVLLI